MKAYLQEIEDFFRITRWPAEIERRPTFFSIAGFPHYENVMSNVYQFFFRTDNPHGLGSLCVDALLDVLRRKNEQLPWPNQAFKRAYAQRELPTSTGRLDILLHNSTLEDEWEQATAAILIENKVYHYIANDLNEYWRYFDSELIGNRKVGVVMGLRVEPLPIDWVYITHLEWAQAVESRLGFAVYRAESRYLTLLLELIENIRTMTKADEDFREVWTFFQHNRAAISRAEKIRNDVFLRFPSILKTTLAEYSIWTSAESNRDGWLIIYKQGSTQFKYVLGYYEIFHEDEVIPTYRIQLVGEDSCDTGKECQARILSDAHASRYNLKPDDSVPHHVLEKIYPLLPSEQQAIPELIAESLRNEWQPMEKYWLNQAIK